MRFPTGLSTICFLLLANSTLAVAQADAITVKLVNGKNNRPVPRARVYVVLGDTKTGSALDLVTDKLGQLHFEAPAVRSFQLRTVGFYSCEEEHSGIHNPNYSTAKVHETGVVSRNGCGTYNAEVVRDVLVLYVKAVSALDMFRN